MGFIATNERRNPATPTGLTATAVSSIQINLSWNASTFAAAYRIRRDGASIAIINAPQLTYNDSQLTPATAYSYTIAAIAGGGFESLQSAPVVETTLAGGGAGTYTPTHYVAPFAQVPGAANDEDIQTQTAYNNATNQSTPCTLSCAHRFAVAGNKVRVAPGEYLATTRWSDRYNPVWSPANNGTLGNPIVFFAQYPAAYNRSNLSLCSKLRRPTGPTYIGPTIQPILGPCFGDSLSRNYVIWDGFYIDEIESRSGPSAGCVQIQGGATGIEIRRFFFSRAGGVSHGTWSGGGNGYDGNSIWGQGCTDVRIVDCYWEGGTGTWPGNDIACQFYAGHNVVIEHCTVMGPTGLSDFKAAINRNCVSRYNWVEYGNTGTLGIGSQICTNTLRHHNFVKGASQCEFWFNPAQQQITAATSTNPIRFTTQNAHLLNTGDVVSFASEEPLPGDFGTNLNGTMHAVTVVNSTQFTIAVDGSSYAPYTSEGTTQVITPIQSHHNTFVCTGGTFSSSWYMRAIRPSNRLDEFHSNIVVINGPSGGTFCNLGDGAAVDIDGNFDRLNYNVYYRIDGNGSPRWEVGTSAYTTFSGVGSYQAAMAAFGTDAHGETYEANSIYADPLFVNPAATNYRLQAGSPALTAALGGGIAGCFDNTGEVGMRTNPTY